MANSLTAYNPEYWASEAQVPFFKENVVIALANTKLESDLRDGDRVHKPYGTYPLVQTYTKGGVITIPDYSSTDDYLDVDTAKVAPMYIDDIDKLQNKWDQAGVFARRAGRTLSNVLDQAVLAEYSNASSYIAAADMGGSGTGSFVPSTANIPNLFAVAGRKLDGYDVDQPQRFAVIGPRLKELLRLYAAGRETGFGDAVGANGIIGSRFGFDIYYSNNLPFGATWTPIDKPTANDTVTIAGVTFTFVASATAAGDIAVGANLAASLDNLVACINRTGTAGTGTYIAPSDRNRFKLTKAGLVVTNSANTALTIVAYGDIVVAASEAADVWSAQIQYPLFGIKGAIDLVVQQKPNVEFRMVQDKLGRNVFVWMMFGKKVFVENADALVYAKINGSSWA